MLWYFLSGALAALLFSEALPLCNFSREYYKEQFCEIILNWGQWYRRCRLKDFLSGALQPSYSVERNNLCNFETGHHEGLDGGGGGGGGGGVWYSLFTKNLAHYSSL